MRFVLEHYADQDLLAVGITKIKCKNVQAHDYAMQYFFLPFRSSELHKFDRLLPIRTGGFYRLPSIRFK